MFETCYWNAPKTQLQYPHRTHEERLQHNGLKDETSFTSLYPPRCSKCMSWSVWQEKPFPITILWLDASSKCTRKGVEANHYFFPPSAPLGSLHYSKKTFTEPCTSLYIFGTKLDLPTSQTQKKGRRRRRERGVKKKMKAAFKKFILSSLLLIPYCLVPINGAGILWELSIYHSWDFHVSAIPQKKVRQLSDMLLKATNVQHKHREFNAGFFFHLLCFNYCLFAWQCNTHKREPSRR